MANGHKIVSLPGKFFKFVSDTMRLFIAALALLYSSSIYSQSASSPDLPGALRIQMGFNFLVDSPDSMDTGFWGSKAFNVQYIYSIRLGKSAFSLHPGFGISTDKFSFDNNVTLVRNLNDKVSLEPLERVDFGDVKKTKLAATYLEIPLELRFHANKKNFKKSFKVAVGGKLGILISSHTKIKYEKLDEGIKLKTKDNFELNRFRYGLEGSIGFAGISVYYYYGLNSLFEKGQGPESTEAFQTQVGLAISVF